MSSFARGVVVSNAIVAANLPVACGLALAAKQDGRATVTLAAFGDGATNQAVFHEALNLAVIWRLPVIFVCENNQYSEMTPIRTMVGVERLVDRVRGYGIATETCDGMDVEAVRAAAADAADRARGGGGPTFIEAETYRFCGHMPGDAETYRSRDEVEAWRARDPLTIARTRLATLGVGETEVAAVDDTVERRLSAALDAARAAPPPDPAAVALGASPYMEVTR